MKINFLASLIIFLYCSCSPQVKTDEKLVKKTITVTEHLILNQNFDKLDLLHQQKEIKKFDINNNILENTDCYGPDSIFGGKLIYKYDNNGKKVEEYLISLDKEIMYSYRYEYMQNQSNTIEISKDGRKVKRGVNYYDTNGNLIRQVTLYDDGKIMGDFSFKYNFANLEIERSRIVGEKKMETHYKGYDSLSHFLVEQKSIDSNGIVFSYEKFLYEGFDKNGNWIIRKSFSKGIPRTIAFQKIEYK
jgi:hypothetical protein